MPDEIRRIDYFHMAVPDRHGAGARVLAALQAAGVNLLGFSEFPHGAHRSQLDLIPEDSVAFRKAARTAGLKVSRKKTGFLIQGEDRVGAMTDLLGKLADAGVNVTAVDAVASGEGRYAALLWVAQDLVTKAGRLLGATR